MTDVFVPLIGPDDGVPAAWCVAPLSTVAVRFAVDRAALDGGAAAAVVTVDDGPPIAADRETVTPATEVWLARVTVPAAPATLVIRAGVSDRAGTWHWQDPPRRLLAIDAPDSVTAIPRTVEPCPIAGVLDGPVPPGGRGAKLTPSPPDWRRRLFYNVLIDRFALGDTGRAGLGLALCDPDDPGGVHGGDLAGLTDKLDYLQALGVGALVLSPVYLNAADGYHGYHPLHLLAVEPRLGGLDALKALVAAAHQRGIAVLIDVIVNHLADCLVWRDGGDGRAHGRFRFDAGEANAYRPYPRDLADPAFFHPPGGDDLVGVPLFGFLADWRTEHAYVRDRLIDHLKYWIAAADIDGFRFDAVRHVDLDFWRRAVPAVAAYARALGKADFLMLGEHAGHAAREVGRYSRAAGFSGMIDYPFHYHLRRVFDGVGDPAAVPDLAAYLEHDAFAYRDSRLNLAFLDNQDTSRFLAFWGDRFASLDAARAALRAALAVVMLGPALPALYYGTEQEFSGAIGRRPEQPEGALGHDHYVREDMFANPGCAWLYGPINRPMHAPYDRSNPSFRTIAALAALRRALPAVHAGDRVGLVAGADGLLVWAMWAAATGDLAVIAVNLSRGRAVRHRLAAADLARRLPAGALARWHAAVGQGQALVPADGFADGPLSLNGEGLGVYLPPLGVAVGRLG